MGQKKQYQIFEDNSFLMKYLIEVFNDVFNRYLQL